jgi:CPA2 family monovalent cation:H+ antiporter-2
VEGSLMLAGHALALVGVPMKRVIRITRDARDARYSLLRGYFHGADDSAEELDQARLQSVTLPEAARCLGQALQTLALHTLEVSVVSVRSASGGVSSPGGDHVLSAGETLVLSGRPERLALAEQLLLRG